MKIITVIFLLMSFTAQSQYDFEKYPTVKYQEYDNWKIYDWTETKQTINHTISINQFFTNGDSLTIQLTSYTAINKKSTIRFFKNKEQTQVLTEIMNFNPSNVQSEPVRIVDFNGDGLKDIKMNIPYKGNGLAALNFRIIYFFQTKNGQFIKISFDDKMDGNRKEYDFDNNGNHEIITMNLINYRNNNYWTFNIFEFNNGILSNVNYKANYPIMVQFLNKKNYKITERIDREKMKDFKIIIPENLD